MGACRLCGQKNESES